MCVNYGLHRYLDAVDLIDIFEVAGAIFLGPVEASHLTQEHMTEVGGTNA